MQKIISVNCGSSSLKFQLFEMPEEKVLASGIAERIGLDMGIYTIKVNGEKHTTELEIKNHEIAVNMLLESLIKFKVVDSLEEIVGSGHRVVQGGDYFKSSSLATDENIEKVLEFAKLAPLHNKANGEGCIAFKNALPHAKNAFVFDTAFHQTMTPDVYTYAVPYSWYTEHSVRRYGAHGTSHQYVSERAADLMKKDIKDTRIITCHLGNGASITAVNKGKCVNTSMGFTPLGGIMMGTRSGDIDPAIVSYMSDELGKSASEIVHILNKESGMLGISEISSDARDVEMAADEGNPRAILTQDIYVNRVVNTVGGYILQMGGVDALVFTAGLGENDSKLRLKILDAMTQGLGLSINLEKNSERGKELLISNTNSKVDVFVIPTNEELVIARDTYALINDNK